MQGAQDAKRCAVTSAGPKGAPGPLTRLHLQLPAWTALSGELFLPLRLYHRRRPPFGKEGCEHTTSFLVPI